MQMLMVGMGMVEIMDVLTRHSWLVNTHWTLMGIGGAVDLLGGWIEKNGSSDRNSRCAENQKYISGLAPQIRGMLRATQPTMIQSAIFKAGILTDEAVRYGTLTRSSEKIKEVEETSKQGETRFTLPEIVGAVSCGALLNPSTGSSRNSLALEATEILNTVGIQARGRVGYARFGYVGSCEILRVQGERSLGGTKTLMSTKADEPELSDIPILRVHEDDILKTAFRTRYGHFEFTVMPCWVNPISQQVFMELNVRAFENRYLDKFVLFSLMTSWSTQRLKKDHEVHLQVDVGGCLRRRGLAGYYRHFIMNFSKIAKPLTSLTQKNKKYDWGVEQEEAFQTLKYNLYNALIMSLPDRIEDFVVYCDASNQGLGCVLMQRGKLFSDYECEIRYHPDKANVVADALSRKELDVETLDVLDQQMERKEEESLYFMDRIWVPLMGGTRSKSGNDTIWVTVDRLTKSAHFLACMLRITSMEKLARLYIDEIVARHGVPVLIISDRDGRFTSCFWKTLQKALRTQLDMSTTYHPQKDGQRGRTIQTLEGMLRVPFKYSLCSFEALYGMKHVGSRLLLGKRLIGPELVQEMTDKVVLIKEKIKAARDRVIRFGKKGKLALRYVGPFEILERIGPVAYRLRLPEELSSVHGTFHVSNLKKCLADANLHVPLDEIKVDKTLCFVEEPVEIMDREDEIFLRRGYYDNRDLSSYSKPECEFKYVKYVDWIMLHASIGEGLKESEVRKLG
ncbi:putative reverse transcriptase domain-containing protein [Tanacetum coccineum]|uniref:Reverse transcriptase domain-containing protein n=1 Tax=Tanacetum coccineum TaxID=301880 RepID=A0ABQ5AGU8_9ASTR